MLHLAENLLKNTGIETSSEERGRDRSFAKRQVAVNKEIEASGTAFLPIVALSGARGEPVLAL